MTRYLLSIYQPEGPALAPEVMDRVALDLHVLNGEALVVCVRSSAMGV